MPSQEAQSNPIRLHVYPLQGNQRILFSAKQTVGRTRFPFRWRDSPIGPLLKVLWHQPPVTQEAAVNQRMRALRAEEVSAHRRTPVVGVERNDREGLAPALFVSLFIVQETHLAGGKIQLNAIMAKAVIAEHSHGRTTGGRSPFLAIVSHDARGGHH